jgi:signal transduction histidine kinase
VTDLRTRLAASMAARLVLGYGAIAAVALITVASMIYFGTIRVLEQTTDARIETVAARLTEALALGGAARLRADIYTELHDRADTDTEVIMLVNRSGVAEAGNLSALPAGLADDSKLHDAWMRRAGHLARTRVLVSRLPDGAILLVGRDMSELQALQEVMQRALLTGLLIAAVLVLGGAYWLRRAINRRIAQVRLVTHQVGAGDLAQRLPDLGEDEFSLLSRDINRMLAQIESLMDGVQHVSNAIAHDLRTPLSRVRNRLYIAVRSGDAAQLREVAQHSIDDVDSLIGLFEKLLRIASAESGMRPAFTAQVALGRLVESMVDLYEASAEEAGQQLQGTENAQALQVCGDADLIASAVAGLLDNAIKYAGQGARIDLGVALDAASVSITVSDNGIGVPQAELGLLGRRFYRVDQARHLPGNGIGLSNVKAIMALHGGTLELHDAGPGLLARMRFPRP